MARQPAAALGYPLGFVCLVVARGQLLTESARIAAFDFRDSIAGAVEAFCRATMGGATWGSMIGGFLVPTILGILVGGAVLVAPLGHGQTGERNGR